MSTEFIIEFNVFFVNRTETLVQYYSIKEKKRISHQIKSLQYLKRECDTLEKVKLQ